MPDTTVGDVKGWMDDAKSTSEYLRNQIDNINNSSDPGVAEKSARETMGYAADMLGGIPGAKVTAEATKRVLAVVEFSEPSFPTEDAIKQQNSVLRALIDLSNFLNDLVGGEGKPNHYPDGPFLDDTDPRQKEIDDWKKTIEDTRKRLDDLFSVPYIDTGTSCKIDPAANGSYGSALSFVQRIDPLALDLDGDGLETVSANSGIIFDFDGDGLKTGTGWVGKDDGLLVWDRNGDGGIDTGAELFGVDFVKSNGQKATNGFDALRDLDSNGDGVFDANDAQFANVRVWQDLNQDGVSQADELKSLADHHITSINLTATNSNQNNNGNIISAIGSFVRDDGSTGQVNGNQSVAGNLDLTSNPFYREFTDHLPVDETAKALPDMRGSGAVRDLREATMQNAALKGVLAEYASAQTREQQMGLLDRLLTEWANSSGYRTFEQRVSDLSTSMMTVDFEWSWEQDLKLAAGGTGGGSSSLGGIDPDSINAGSGPTAEQLQQKALLERVRLLEVFNAQNFFNFTKEEDSSGGLSRLGIKSGASVTQLSNITANGSSGSQGSGGGSIVSNWTLTEKNLVLNAGQAGFINSAYESLRESIYNGLLLQTRLRPYVEAIGITLNDNGLRLDYSEVAALFQASFAQNRINGITDLLEFLGQPVAQHGLNELSPITESSVQSLSADEIARINTLGIGLQVGTASNQSLSGNDKQDYLFGFDGADTLYGGTGGDYLSGGAGTDSLYGEAGNDTLIGGVGNDYLNGGAGSDVYRFERGWGQDTVYNYDTGTSKVDAIEFAAGIGVDDIEFGRSGNDLILKLKGSTDRITVSSYLLQDGASAYKVDEVRFADGTVLNVDQVKRRILLGTEGSDTLYGYASDDLLNGGVGNDTLYGGGGNDTLIGGVGNDYLMGEAGSDVYRFERGWGQDTVYNYDTGTSKVDAIEFAAGIGVDDIEFGRSGNDLILKLKGSTDRITVSSYLLQDGASAYKVDEVRFADGTVLNVDQVKRRILLGTEGSDTLYGYASDDLLNGGVGNDTLYGGGGSDTLIGGAGNDYLMGEAGSDVYRFERGWGQDTVYNYDTGTSKVDAIEFAVGIGVDDIEFGRSGNDLILKLKGSTDRITVSSYLLQDGASAYKVDEVRFADGTVLNVDQVKRRILLGTEGSDTLYGYASDDLLNGGVGNDTLYGGGGNDTLIGGAGNDYLMGEAGSDVYRFERGWGQDTVYNYDTGTSKVDAIEFAVGIGVDDIEFGRSGNDLILKLKGSTDLITVSSYLLQDGASAYKVDEVRFADGTVLNVDQVKRRILLGTEGSDTLYGYASDDLLNGGVGNDTLYGGGGNDTLIGGAGNDYLMGEAGSDVYRFERGWGQDTVYNYDTGTSKVDAIEFAVGIGVDDIEFGRSGNDLILKLKGSTDRITVSSYLLQDGASAYKVDEVRFADGTVLNVDQVKRRILLGTEGSDTLYGYASDDLLNGGVGNDTLYGGGGNDTLIGGAGNDYLMGEAGNDTYVFGRQFGQDAVNNYHTDANTLDQLVFADGITANQLWFRQNGSNLDISVIGTNDKVSISSWYSGSNYHVGQITSADGKTLLESQVQSLVNAMAAFGVPAGGESNLTADQRQQLEVVIAANWQ
ncbi:calcium-binding protein [Pseudomonas sp. SCB32]|uniref:calcium-binding protein n=1 Tax=Pseudomonas sp. SCB32 TaxID=2653853 RepID=UPI001264C910|nr:calcium-binding protein [Pseudomonas sp. SCB32]